MPERRHLITIGDLTADDVERLLASADALAEGERGDIAARPHGRQPLLRELDAHLGELRAGRQAARGDGADDSLRRLVGRQGRVAPGHGADALRLRPGRGRRSATRTPARPSSWRAPRDAHVVNAGDGKRAHPTQALLDLFTMRTALGRLDGLHVAIVGDVLHSRVARSLVQALALVGARATLVGPPTLVPERLGAPVSFDIADISTADVVYVLRMQRERMAPGAAFVPSLREYAARWGVTPERLRPGQRVMHPGPMNRGVEIDARVADSPAALVVDQVRAGLAVRMAVLDDLVGSPAVAAGGGVMLACRNGFRRLARPRGPRRRSDAGHRRVPPADRRGRSCHADSSRRAKAARSLAPAFVDPHVHLRTPGREDEETIASGTAAAAAGGYCAILAMPNTDPVVDSAAVLRGLLAQARDEALVPTGFLAAISKGQRGEELTEMGELADAGAAGFTDDGRPVVVVRAHAARAPVRRRARPPARAPLRGARRSRATGTCARGRSRPSSASRAGRPSPRA